MYYKKTTFYWEVIMAEGKKSKYEAPRIIDFGEIKLGDGQIGNCQDGSAANGFCRTGYAANGQCFTGFMASGGCDIGNDVN
jgi:hypothetical protein